MPLIICVDSPNVATFLEELQRLCACIMARIVLANRIRLVEFGDDNITSMIKDLRVGQTF